jgi:hypothetical protein
MYCIGVTSRHQNDNVELREAYTFAQQARPNLDFRRASRANIDSGQLRRQAA